MTSTDPLSAEFAAMEIKNDGTSQEEHAFRSKWLAKLPPPNLIDSTSTMLLFDVGLNRVQELFGYDADACAGPGYSFEIQIMGAPSHPDVWQRVDGQFLRGAAMLGALHPGTKYKVRARTVLKTEGGVERVGPWSSVATVSFQFPLEIKKYILGVDFKRVETDSATPTRFSPILNVNLKVFAVYNQH